MNTHKKCTHYDRNCAIVSPCCDKVFGCRLCHDEQQYLQQIDIKKSHEIDRTKIKEIICLNCGLKQSISNNCTNCNTVFGKYFCDICNLYDNRDKGQYHCDKCNICRVGGKNNFIHCDICGICVSTENHKCKDNMFDGDCPICMEKIFYSIKSVCRVKCDHLMHNECLTNFLTSGNYKCPICSKALVDINKINNIYEHEVNLHIMPEEYKDAKVDIMCNECLQTSNVNFHIVAMKCSHCLSYNTKRI